MREDKKKIVQLILKALLLVSIITGIAVGVYFALKNANFVQMKDKLGDTIWFWLIIGLLQIVQVIFIPVSNQIITVPIALMFESELWKVWLTSWLSIWLATVILYYLGRFGGQKILNWLLKDKEQVNKCTSFLNRGWIFYPLGMLLPLPDDIITVLAGTAKMKARFVIVCSLLTRAIDTACSVWGWGWLTKQGVWGWIILSVGILALIGMTVGFYFWQKKHLQKESENERMGEDVDSI
ncbi:MAG: TVP38/TMEM64 family protein [Bacilli bacterium]|nr:TVP38/TMEM64 family protein [Bacilli bacterium]